MDDTIDYIIFFECDEIVTPSTRSRKRKKGKRKRQVDVYPTTSNKMHFWLGRIIQMRQKWWQVGQLSFIH